MGQSPERGRSPGAAKPLVLPTGASLQEEDLRALRRFHLGAPKDSVGEDARPGLVPVALHPFRGAPVRGDWPFCVLGDEASEPRGQPLVELLERLVPEGEDGRLLRDNLVRLESHVRNLLAAEEGPGPAAEMLARAGEAMARELGLAGGAGDRLREALAALVDGVSPGAVLVPFGPEAPWALLALAARARQVAALEALRPEAASLAEQGEALLAMDAARRGKGRRAASLGAAVGPVGERLLETKALADVVGPPRTRPPLTPARRRGLEQAVQALRSLPEEPPKLFLVLPPDSAHAGSAAGVEGSHLPFPAEVVTAEDPCAIAAELFDREAEQALELVRAAQRVRLEIAGTFDPERHEAWLATLNWSALTAPDLAIAAPVVVRQGRDHLMGTAGSLARLLLSRRPVHVLLELDPLAGPGGATGGEVAPWRFDPGLLALGVGDAFVQQGSLARPRELFQGFDRAAAGPGAALHVVGMVASAEGAAEALDPVLLAAAAVESRALPLFQFDPEVARTWWRRFDLAANPAVAEDWSLHALEAHRGDQGDEPFELALTLADLALVAPGWAGDLQPLPLGTGGEGLVTVAEWLGLPEDQRLRHLPFVWGAQETGEMVPVLVTRRLAQACGDRLAAWRSLQELAAVRSEGTTVAAQRARDEAEAAARSQREELVGAHRRELEVLRREAMDEAVGRLTAALFDLDPASLAAAPASAGLLPHLAGRSVEEVADALMAALDPATLESTEGQRSDGNGRIAALGDQLLALVDPSALASGDE